MSNSKKKPQKWASNSILTPQQIREIERRYNDNEKLIAVAKAMKISVPSVRYRFELIAEERKKLRDEVYNILLRRAQPNLNRTQH